MEKALVVGCGLSGAVIARELAENWYHVQIIERRNHIAGNTVDNISHVGIYLKKNKFIHASSSRGVVVDDINT